MVADVGRVRRKDIKFTDGATHRGSLYPLRDYCAGFHGDMEVIIESTWLQRKRSKRRRERKWNHPKAWHWSSLP